MEGLWHGVMAEEQSVLASLSPHYVYYKGRVLSKLSRGYITCSKPHTKQSLATTNMQ